MTIATQITALLPMKAHSERVSNKNIRQFAGKPLYHCIAQILQASDFIKTIIINTDSEIIAEQAPKHFSKVKIIHRPPKIQGDLVEMNDVIAYDLSVSEGEHFLQTHSTNPLLTIKTLNNAIESYFNRDTKFDSLFSVTRLQTRLYYENVQPINHNPQELLRTQDLPPVYEENSNIYIFSKESFKKAGNKRIGLRPMMFEMEKLEAIDIDKNVDFQLAELLYLNKERFITH
jgi:CMP-N-acetylneuraminic acid synthetase